MGELDGSIYDEEGERKPNLFCKLCKLLFNQSRESHDESKEHKTIFKFLNPSCEVCDFTKFVTPMSYQKHLCSLRHLKTELDPNASVDDDSKEETDKKESKDDEEEDDDLDNFDFNAYDFITLDEVRDGDEEEETAEPEQEEVGHEFVECNEIVENDQTQNEQDEDIMILKEGQYVCETEKQEENEINQEIEKENIPKEEINTEKESKEGVTKQNDE